MLSSMSCLRTDQNLCVICSVLYVLEVMRVHNLCNGGVGCRDID